MSKWCSTCHRNELTGNWASCDSDCPVFGKDFDDLAKKIIAASVSEEDMLPSNCLYIKGYLTADYNGIPAIKETDGFFNYGTESIIHRIEEYAEKYGFIRQKRTGLGGTQSYIPKCNIRIFFTEKETTLQEAHMLFDEQMYGGALVTDTSLTGYSEYTITGMDLDEFTIGGHDLKLELSSHMGECIHMIIECV